MRHGAVPGARLRRGGQGLAGLGHGIGAPARLARARAQPHPGKFRLIGSGLLGRQGSTDRQLHLPGLRFGGRFKPLQDLPVPPDQEFAEVPLDVAWERGARARQRQAIKGMCVPGR